MKCLFFQTQKFRNFLRESFILFPFYKFYERISYFYIFIYDGLLQKHFSLITNATTETRQRHHQKTIAVDQTSFCR